MATVTEQSAAATGQGARPGGPESARRHSHLAFWIVGYTFAVTMAFSAVPTPLYVLYQARDGFGPLIVTVIFAAYAAGVVASLFFAGHLSDWVGRRRMVALAVAVNMVAGVLFLLVPSIPGLIAGRVISGVSIGMLTASATAYLSELHAAARPGATRTRAEVVATAANLGGIGLGPLLAGLIAQFAGDPLQVPYLVAEGLMLAGAIGLVAVPETANRPDPRPAYRPQRVSAPPAHRSLFLAAATAGGAEFALFGLFTSLAPGVIAGLLHDSSHAVAGAAAFAVFGAAALAQVLLTRATVHSQLRLGLGALVAGLVLVTVAVWLPSLWLLLAGGAVAGAGAGAAFRGGVSTVISITPPEARGEGLAGLFLGAYTGLAVPVVGLGVATQLLDIKVAVLVFAAALVAVTVLVSRKLLAHRALAGGTTVEWGRGQRR